MPALGGVYKLSAELEDGKFVPKIKISENPVKITNPGLKCLYRIYDKDGMAVADLIALDQEVYDTSKPLTIYDPVNTWKSMTLTDYTMKKLQVPLSKTASAYTIRLRFRTFRSTAAKTSRRSGISTSVS